MALVQYLVARFFDREEGQGLAEYALILALIAIIAIVALIFLGGAISGILNTVGTVRLVSTRSPAKSASPHGWRSSVIAAAPSRRCRRHVANGSGRPPPKVLGDSWGRRAGTGCYSVAACHLGGAWEH